MQIQIESSVIAGIPVLLAVAAGRKAAPVVFWVPGYGQGKETGLPLGYQLAQAGFCAVGFDPIHHGARADGGLEPDHAGFTYPPDSGLDIWLLFCRVIAQCAADIDTLLGALASDTRVDATRAGVTGPSMGGYASTLAFATLPALQAAVPMIGVPTFLRRWLDLVDECAFSNPAWAAALATRADAVAADTEFVRRIDPAPLLAAAAPRALLLMNNDFDSDQPKHYAIDAYRTLRPAWAAAPHRLRLAIYPAAHQVTPAMERDAVAWFVEQIGQ